MKTLTVRQVAQLKRTAQNVYPLVSKKNKLYAQIEELNIELESLNTQINAWESATKAMTEGYTSEDLIARNVVFAVNEDGTTKTDKNGQPVKVTKYEANPNMLTFNETTSLYEINDIVKETNEIPTVDGDAMVGKSVDNTFDPATMHDAPAGSKA